MLYERHLIAKLLLKPYHAKSKSRHRYNPGALHVTNLFQHLRDAQECKNRPGAARDPATLSRVHALFRLAGAAGRIALLVADLTGHALPDAHDLELASLKAREFGYRCWRHESPLFNPVNFNLRETDVFLGRTVLAMVAIPEEFDVEARLDGCTELT